MVISDKLLEKLGAAVLPFERRDFYREVDDGEGLIEPFLDKIIKITQAFVPENAICYSLTKISRELPKNAMYIWVIDEECLKIIEDKTPNPFAMRGNVCHSNLTGGKKAFQGGELWFTNKGEIALNFSSGRYGATEPLHEKGVVEYFEEMVIKYIFYQIKNKFIFSNFLIINKLARF